MRKLNTRTFVIIKPDAIRRGLIGEIIRRFELKGFIIERVELRRKTKLWCQLHYSQLIKNELIYLPLVEAMIHEPLIGIILRGPDAVSVVRQMVGATDSTQALPGTIRGDLGTLPVRENLVHASDDEQIVYKEIEFFFNTETDWKP